MQNSASIGRGGTLAAILLSLALTAGGCSNLSDVIALDRPTLHAMQTELGVQASQIAAQGTMIGHLATRPPMVATLPRPGSEPTPYRPIIGAIEFEDGRCCIGGQAGSQVTATLNLEAQSPAGEVTQLRFRVAPTQFEEADLMEDEWQAYVPEISVQIPVMLNWTSYYASVQFRDAAGNLSPVFYDDISVEGRP